MITINLLPADKRKAEKTPLSRFIVLIVGVILLVCAAGGYLYFHIYVLDFARKELEEKQRELVNVNKRHDYYRDLMDLQKKFQDRGDTIKGIRYSRIPWGVKLMQFYDFFIMEEFRDMAWIDGLQMDLVDTSRRRPTRGQAGPVPAGTLKFTVNVVGDDWTPIINFRESLRGERGSAQDVINGQAFWKDFLQLSDPSPKLETDKDKDPPSYYTEDIEIDVTERKAPDKKKTAASSGGATRGGAAGGQAAGGGK